MPANFLPRLLFRAPFVILGQESIGDSAAVLIPLLILRGTRFRVESGDSISSGYDTPVMPHNLGYMLMAVKPGMVFDLVHVHLARFGLQQKIHARQPATLTHKYTRGYLEGGGSMLPSVYTTPSSL